MKSTDTQETAAAKKAAERSFSTMTGAEKAKHIGKVIIFLISFGFIFPGIFSD